MVTLLIFFLFQFPPLPLVSAAYDLPNRYFINCGSASTVSNINARAFVGDVNPVNSVSLSPSGRSKTVEDSDSSATGGLYRSARVFTEASSYEFGIDDPGLTHVVRFHFFHFPSVGDLSAVRFHVSASGTPLLTNFTVGHRNFTHLPPIEEFLLRIPSDKLKIEFAPAGKGIIAFVNAIEVFLAPPKLLPDSSITIPYVTPVRQERDYEDLPNKVLRVIHRINVGGPNIMPNNDTLLRYWIPDDNLGFMINRDSATKSQFYNGRLNYASGGATQFNAPDYVYRTAKQMRIIGDGRSSDFNVSWRFDVSIGAQHLVRLHFCDIVSNTTNEFLRFNLYLYSMFKSEVWPFDVNPQLETPFYKDYVVKSDDSGFMNISIGPSTESQGQTSAFLNGVEIMELVGSINSSGSGSNSTRRHTFVIIGSTIGGGIVVLALVVLAIWCLVRRKKKSEPEEAYAFPLMPYGGSSYSRTTVRTVSDSPLADLNLGLKLSFSDVLNATNKFDPKLLVGQGGFGKVYKGTLNRQKVAVKRSEQNHGQGLYEFHTEIYILSKIRHRHLVSLKGYCDEMNEMILVYEFMEKGTLREHLYVSEGEGRESASGSRLGWEQRLKICIDSAKGLHYLHTGSSPQIIHRDIKSTNILLDEDYVAKVADFGLSLSNPENETHVSTQVKGSFGYLDPEYFKLSQLTQKSDVYSFGVVLLEVLCARPALNKSLPQKEVNLADWGLSWIRKGELDKIIDPLLEGNINPNCLRKFCEIVEKCLQECGTDRPNMVDVLWDLEYCQRLQQTVNPGSPYYYGDSSVNMAMELPMTMLPRMLSDTVREDETVGDSREFSEASQVDDANVFSQLKLGEAR